MRRGRLGSCRGFPGGIGVREAMGRDGFGGRSCGGAKGGGFGIGVRGGRCEAGSVCYGAGHGGYVGLEVDGFCGGAETQCS